MLESRITIRTRIYPIFRLAHGGSKRRLGLVACLFSLKACMCLLGSRLVSVATDDCVDP